MSEVCAACASRTPHTQVIAHTTSSESNPAAQAQHVVRLPVAGGFSAPAGPGGPTLEPGTRRAPRARQDRDGRRPT
ncbi:hypothetical protein GCM10010289_85880 [Streptomyces violascens]|nr:hypothetical protein GCM10010289_85880 [Streptomyces violascens]